MITGDKQETAINIAIACKLVHHPDSLIVINAADSNEAARARLEEALQHCRERHAASVGFPPPTFQPERGGRCLDWVFSMQRSFLQKSNALLSLSSRLARD